MQSIWFCGKKGHPIQFALNAIRGATGKRLKANDLIKASQASPLTHCIKAICWLLNKRIIFYLDFCVRERVPFRSWIQVGACQCSVYASYPWVTLWACYLSRFFFFSSHTFKCHMCMGCTCSSSGQTWRTSQAFACSVSGNDVGMRLSLQVKKWKHIKEIVHLSRYNPKSLTRGRGTMRKDGGGAWKLSESFFVASTSNVELYFILI